MMANPTTIEGTCADASAESGVNFELMQMDYRAPTMFQSWVDGIDNFNWVDGGS